MGWKIPSLLNSRLSYELQIHKSTDPVQRREENKNYTTLTNPGTYTVKIRTQRRHSDNQYSAWSAPQRFECGHEEESSLSVWQTSLLIALGTLLALGLAALLCRRYSVIQKVFPPIPRVKDPIKDNFLSDSISMMVWDEGSACLEECRVEEVQLVGES
ncbi:interleukin-3 receptor subunit alpha isoform X3 [Choloepus didactylus]|nr:interleukin-3 receptor subunit alpha isoform X3 [Choloepus didactylus]